MVVGDDECPRHGCPALRLDLDVKVAISGHAFVWCEQSVVPCAGNASCRGIRQTPAVEPESTEHAPGLCVGFTDSCE